MYYKIVSHLFQTNLTISCEPWLVQSVSKDPAIFVFRYPKHYIISFSMVPPKTCIVYIGFLFPLGTAFSQSGGNKEAQIIAVHLVTIPLRGGV